jgi:hypothetical protein
MEYYLGKNIEGLLLLCCRENPHRPFRCLDYQYRRELVRVYMTNVEGICRRFMEEKREKIGKLIEDSVGWSRYNAILMPIT